jgi:hypothetical protein
MFTDICSNRHGGNTESKTAFHSLKGFLARQRAEIIILFDSHPEGLIAEEIEELLHRERSSVSARCSELKASGILVRKPLLVDEHGTRVYERRRTKSGRSAAVLMLSGEKSSEGIQLWKP